MLRQVISRRIPVADTEVDHSKDLRTLSGLPSNIRLLHCFYSYLPSSLFKVKQKIVKVLNIWRI